MRLRLAAAAIYYTFTEVALSLSSVVAQSANASVTVAENLTQTAIGKPARRRLDKRAAGFLWACIVVAECCSCAGTVTTDRLFFLGEEGSWVVGFTVFLPFALALARRIPGDDDCWKAARCFARVLAVCVCCYVPWGWLSDVPSNYEAWRKDQAAGKRYFGFWDGLEDAATTRRETRAWDAWGHKLLWMTAYFTLGVWSSIALVSAPRKRSDKRIPLLARELSVSIC